MPYQGHLKADRTWGQDVSDLFDTIQKVKEERRNREIGQRMMQIIAGGGGQPEITQELSRKPEGRGGIPGMLDVFNPMTAARGTSPLEEALRMEIMKTGLDPLAGIRKKLLEQRIETPEEIESGKRLRAARVTGAEADVSPERLAQDAEARRLAIKQKKQAIKVTSQNLKEAKTQLKVTEEKFRRATSDEEKEGAKLELERLRTNVDILKEELKNIRQPKPEPTEIEKMMQQGLSREDATVAYRIKVGLETRTGREKTFDIKQINEYLRELQGWGTKELDENSHFVIEQMLQGTGYKLKKMTLQEAKQKKLFGIDKLWPDQKEKSKWVIVKDTGEEVSTKVKMKAPDGKTYEVDPSQVDEAEGHGWTRL